MMKRILIGPVLLDRINRFRVFTRYLAGNGMLISLFRFRDRRYMAGILPIWRKTQNNQSINQFREIYRVDMNLSILHFFSISK